MAEASITFLVEALKDVQKWHKKLISAGSEDEFELLSKDLLLLRAFFKDATNHLKITEMLRLETERRIRYVVYDIEDAIDTFLLRAEANSKSAIRRHLDLINRISLAKEVRLLRIYTLKPLYERVKEDFLRLGIAQGAATSSEEQLFRLEKSESICEEKFMGFKAEEDTLISKLMKETKELGVITICGMDGSGKTTLARKIFEDEEICLEFPTRIWIPVSRSFNSRDVFLNILERFTSDGISHLSDHDLARAVHLCLEEEKFLLVIDDLWSSENWNEVKNGLPKSNALGKVLITTQSLSMAEDASVGEPFMLRSLNDEESWKLLELEVFGKLKDCSTELRVVGEKIAQVCHGLPLAIVMIGGILEDMFVKAAGPIPVLKNKLETMSEMNYRSKVVELSYDRLSGYLKECFLYVAVFPEYQHTIQAQALMQLWIAEGFIPPKEGKTLEETAEECLDELISRKLLMVDRVNPIGKIKTCRVHNLIREFAKSKAIEQDLFHEIRTPSEGVVEKFNRLCLYSESELTKFLSEKPKGTRVRSFLCFYREPVHLDPKSVSTIPDAFSLLRVLDSKCIKFTQFPAWITKLIHVRYITLNIDTLTVLPESISWLWNLETLIVETKSRSITMKANIWQMYRMRHLKTKATIVLDDTKWEGKAGGNLQTVSRLSPESCTGDVSGRASNLKTLGIQGKLSTLFVEKTDFLQKMSSLQELKMVNGDKPLNGLPSDHSYFPSNLKRLTLSNTFLKWKHMVSLAEIKSLEILKLKDNAFTGIYWSVVDIQFPKLQFLLIANTDLVHWEASTKYSFPNLNCLVIKKCENLHEIPEALAENLAKLDIERIAKSAVASARRIAERKAKSGIPFNLSIGPRC